MATKLTQEQFISKAIKVHGNKYDYSKVVYVNNATKIILTCKTHCKEFTISPNHHICGRGCKLCAYDIIANKLRKHKDAFVAKSIKIHGNTYDYTKSNYTNNITKLVITCKEHGDFSITPTHHYGGTGCPICKQSKGVRRITSYLMTKNIQYMTEHRFTFCRRIKPLPFDFYLPNHNMCIEFDGEHHYHENRYKCNKTNLQQQKTNDSIKTTYCIYNNIKLIRIPYWDIDNIETILEKALLN